MEHTLELAEVISELRKELNVAVRSGEGHDTRFKVNSIDVEFETVIHKEATGKAGGKIKFWVLDVDAETSVKYAKAATHRIKLNLTPEITTTDKEGNQTTNSALINQKATKSSKA